MAQFVKKPASRPPPTPQRHPAVPALAPSAGARPAPPASINDLPVEILDHILTQAATARDARAFERAVWPGVGRPEAWRIIERRLPSKLHLEAPKNPTNRYTHAFKDGADPDQLAVSTALAVAKSMDFAKGFAPRSPLTQQLKTDMGARLGELYQVVSDLAEREGRAPLRRDEQDELTATFARLDPGVTLSELVDQVHWASSIEPYLLRLLVSDDVRVRWACLESLTVLRGGSIELLSAAIELRRDPCADIRKLASRVVAEWSLRENGSVSRSLVVELLRGSGAKGNFDTPEAIRDYVEEHLWPWTRETQGRYTMVARIADIKAYVFDFGGMSYPLKF